MHLIRVEILIRLCHNSGGFVLDFQPRRPGFFPKAVHIGFVTDDVGGTGLLPSTSVCICQFSFHHCTIYALFMHSPGWYVQYVN